MQMSQSSKSIFTWKNLEKMRINTICQASNFYDMENVINTKISIYLWFIQRTYLVDFCNAEEYKRKYETYISSC